MQVGRRNALPRNAHAAMRATRESRVHALLLLRDARTALYSSRRALPPPPPLPLPPSPSLSRVSCLLVSCRFLPALLLTSPCPLSPPAFLAREKRRDERNSRRVRASERSRRDWRKASRDCVTRIIAAGGCRWTRGGLDRRVSLEGWPEGG
jgi:hypothetical protein